MARIWALLGLVLVWLGAALPAHAANERMDRLPRESFDVIAPSTRVQGERGDMRAWQRACRVGPTNWARRRIVFRDGRILEDVVQPPLHGAAAAQGEAA